MIAKHNHPYAFIDLQKIRHVPEYVNLTFNSNAIENKNGKWLNVFDGLFFINDQRRNYIP